MPHPAKEMIETIVEPPPYDYFNRGRGIVASKNSRRAGRSGLMSMTRIPLAGPNRRIDPTQSRARIAHPEPRKSAGSNAVRA
jgi:hypothetical protein